jgi:diketogulonate reductase-like aldo/keto reductase
MAKSLTSTVPLSHNNLNIPIVGFGTHQLRGDDSYAPTLAALKAGYRHVDTASVYGNEEAVGRAIRDSGIPRSEIFLTTKLSAREHGFEKALKAYETSCQKLGVDYVDLYLVHYPGDDTLPSTDKSQPALRRESWRALEKLYQEGKAKSIGVSNYMVNHLEDMWTYAKVRPCVNQCEYHPKLLQGNLVEYCAKQGIVFEAYALVGQGHLLKEEIVLSISKAHEKTPAQVLFRWGLQKKTVILSRTAHESRIKENAEIFDFDLTSEEMKRLDSLDSNTHYCWDPTEIP